MNGLIPVSRPIGTEAAAGNNPLSHVGKICNVPAHRLARQVPERVQGLGEVYVMLAEGPEDVGRLCEEVSQWNHAVC